MALVYAASVARCARARGGGYGDNAKWGVRSRPIQSIRLQGTKGKEKEGHYRVMAWQGRNLGLVSSPR